MLGLLLATGGLSLTIAQSWLSADPDGAFYLMPFRFFEFALGAAVVWLIPIRMANRQVLESIAALGIVLVAYPIFAFSNATAFPGVAALVPCLGAALLIYCGDTSRLYRILRSRLAVAVGLISYSLHLVHWPLLVFYRY